MIQKSFRLLLFCVTAVVALPLAAEQKKTITPEDIANLQVVRDVQISPDGKWIAFAAGKRSDFDQLRESSIWLVAADGSEPPRLLHKGENEQTSPRWSPDGKSIAFLQAGSKTEEAKQVWLLRLDNAEANALTDVKGGVDSFQWSPDGKWLAFAATDSPSQEEEQKSKTKDDAIYVNHNYKFSRLWCLNPVDRSVRLISHQDVNVNDFDWSPDGSQLVARISDTPLLDDVYYRSRLTIISVQTGEMIRTIDPQPGTWLNIHWSPDGRWIAYSKLSPNGIAEWRMLATSDASAVRQIDDKYNGTILAMEWLPDSKSLLATSFEGTRAKFVNIDAESGKISPLMDYFAPYADFTISADGRSVAFVAEQADSPANVWIWKRGASPKRLTNFQPEVASWNSGAVREITWRNKKDNTLLYGVLITPPDFSTGRSYPTVVQIHGGPEWAWWSGWHGSWHEWGQLLASNGYVVFLPNPRGSDGQDWRFVEANIEDWGGMDFEDIMNGLDVLIAEHIADPDRLGIGGWSYGGFMSAWTVTHTNRFKAAIIGAGVTDLFSMSGTGDIPTFLNHYFKDTPFHRRSAYDAHSPMTFLQNCTTPSLVLHGDADPRVPLTQGSEFYNGLKMLGRVAEMVIYPREAHGFKEHLHQLDLQKRVLAWYDRYLKGR